MYMNKRSISQDLRSRRRALGWTQAQLAERAGLSQQHLSAIERERLTPEISTLKRLFQALGLELVVNVQRPVQLLSREEQREQDFRRWARSSPEDRLDQVEALRQIYYDSVARFRKRPRFTPSVKVVDR